MRIQRSMIAALCVVPCVLAAGALPAVVGAYATLAAPPSSSTASGLPDGRVYELASPFDKHGFQAGAQSSYGGTPSPFFSIASPNGDGVAFGSTGPAADTDSSGLSQDFVAERTSSGWVSRSAVARGLGQNTETSLFVQTPVWRDYSPDLSHLAYSVQSAQVAGAPHGFANFYLLGSEPLSEPTWLLREALPALKTINTELVGMSPDASVVYIAYEGRLLPEDASREGWGLYESRNGMLSEVGVLPNGDLPAGGARPPATAVGREGAEGFEGENNPAAFDNQVSEDGMRVLFVSANQLYVHEIEPDGNERSVLVSASQLPGHLGEAAPDGVTLFENRVQQFALSANPIKSGPTYAYASPDGSHVFFQSADRLTAQAPAASEPKVYDFDVDTGSLEYLPDVTLGGIVTAASDGSWFVFVDGDGSSPNLDLWSAGSQGGSVRQITQLPGGGYVGPGRIAAGNSVLVFQAQAPIAGFNNADSEQVYRYDIATNELGCISCPPAGVRPSGDAYLSTVDQYGNPAGSVQQGFVVNDVRGVSSDGKRIFFTSPDPLVVRDTNGKLDPYEWDDGAVFLLSSGTSAEDSLFLDNSLSGGDVFFATSDELVEGDNDAGFDVYDARVPRPGDSPPPSAVPCSGDVCQGPPSVPQLLGSPPSATFSGAGNLVEEQSASKAKSSPKRLTRPQKLARAVSACHKQKSKHKRKSCEKRARKSYATAEKSAKRSIGRGN
jgi:hypothetical protein